jgi:hypothetical protein
MTTGHTQSAKNGAPIKMPHDLFNPWGTWHETALPGPFSLYWLTRYVGPMRTPGQLLPFSHLLPREKQLVLRYGKCHNKNVLRTMWKFDYVTAREVYKHDADAINNASQYAVQRQQEHVANVGLCHAIVLGMDIALQTALCSKPTRREAQSLSMVVRSLSKENTSEEELKIALHVLDTLKNSSPAYSTMIPCLSLAGTSFFFQTHYIRVVLC